MTTTTSALVVSPLGTAGFQVTGGSRPHLVNARGTECDCESHRWRPGRVCKHRRAVLAHLEPAPQSPTAVGAAGPGLEVDAPPPEPLVRPARGAGASDAERPLRFRIYPEAALADLPAPSWLLQGILPWAGLAVLFGAPGSGKSFLALAWAMAVARGADWLGHRALWSPTVYVAGEGGRGFVPRVAAYREAIGEPARDSDSAFFLFGAPNLLEPGDVTAFLDDLRSGLLPGNPGLIVLDTLARVMPGGEENSARDVGLVIAAADRIREAVNAAVLIVHHSTKNGEVERGSSALRGAADAMFALKNDEGALTLEHIKAKDSELLPVRQLRLVKAGASCVVEPADHRLEPTPTIKPRALKVLRALQEHFAGAESGVIAWLRVAAVSEASFYRALKQLVELGYVTKTKNRYVLSVTGEHLLSSSQSTITELS